MIEFLLPDLSSSWTVPNPFDVVGLRAIAGPTLIPRVLVRLGGDMVRMVGDTLTERRVEGDGFGDVYPGGSDGNGGASLFIK